MYEAPRIDDVGSVAELTQAIGMGGGSDSTWPILEWAERKFGWDITHS